MDRGYEIPDKNDDETNDEFCKRAAESIPPDVLLRQLMDYLKRTEKKRKTPAWSFVGQFTGHGSGISGAIVRRFSD